MERGVVVAGNDPGRRATTILLRSRGGWQRARVSRPRTTAWSRSAVLWITGKRFERRRAAAHEHHGDGGALPERNARSATRRTLSDRRTLIRRHDRVRNG